MKKSTKTGFMKAPKVGGSKGSKIPRPEAQPTGVSKKVPDVSAAPFLGPSITSRPKPRRI